MRPQLAPLCYAEITFGLHLYIWTLYRWLSRLDAELNVVVLPRLGSGLFLHLTCEHTGYYSVTMLTDLVGATMQRETVQNKVNHEAWMTGSLQFVSNRLFTSIYGLYSQPAINWMPLSNIAVLVCHFRIP